MLEAEQLRKRLEQSDQFPLYSEGHQELLHETYFVIAYTWDAWEDKITRMVEDMVVESQAEDYEEHDV